MGPNCWSVVAKMFYYFTWGRTEIKSKLNTDCLSYNPCLEVTDHDKNKIPKYTLNGIEGDRLLPGGETDYLCVHQTGHRSINSNSA